MYSNKKIQEITIGKDRLHVWYKANAKKEILFSDLNGIYLIPNKINQMYAFLSILLALSIATSSFLYLQLEPTLFISFVMLTVIIIKMNNYKKYNMKIKLKDGSSIEKQVPIKAKNGTIDFVNDVRKRIYDDKIENNK